MLGFRDIMMNKTQALFPRVIQVVRELYKKTNNTIKIYYFSKSIFYLTFQHNYYPILHFLNIISIDTLFSIVNI